MKKLFKLVLAVALMPVMLNAQGIVFEKGSFNEALNKAKKENKLLFIDGYAVWCAPCKRMEKTVFTEENVASFVNEHMVSLKVDVEHGEGPKIKNKYRIHSLPGFVFLNGDGEVVYRITSSMEAEEFLEEAKTAVEFKNDPNSIGRLAERYDEKKNDEAYLKLYLDKLLAAKVPNYVDVLEQYLSIQTTIDVSSKDMVYFLADHMSQIVVGGQADNIIDNNIKTEAWKKYVRKDIRAKYLKLPKQMVERTTEYAIQKRDTTKLELALTEAQSSGLIVGDIKDHRKRVYTYYYLNVGEGEAYKNLVHDDNVALIESIDQEGLRESYLALKKRIEGGDVMAKGIIHHSTKFSGQIMDMAKKYARFAKSEEEQAEVLSWIKVANYIKPEDAFVLRDYANILYKFGKKEEALSFMADAAKFAKEADSKRAVSIITDYEDMKAEAKLSL
ncbi:DUF255 domain-containing protein [Aestuariibaculum sp. YM273]|uniref:thioredoxin family protein n=1 Tax=Aestuariibaculum sp. YM273 TaxID=3070659 RepID=UPI0027DCE1FC|nr:thioredoxin fold domain-containing protein [Aestuariibaculum sp. YM273]WMI66019.1 DUF255 domain-containing protein [Aestuariibaculum sp. YM273]